MAKPTIEQLEDELRNSRTQAWEVETFLAKRHQAKIEALTEPERSRWSRRWEVAKEAFWELMGVFGVLMFHIILALWILQGRFPLRA